MEDPDSIQSMSETASLLPSPTVVTSERPQRPAIRRIRNSSIRLSHTEPTSLIVRNRDTISTTQQSNNNVQEADEEFQGNCCTDPRSRCHRLIALILMCLLGFGSYFCMDNPAALQQETKDAMGINTYQFSLLYAWYSWPNVILPLVGGYMMDSVFGIRLGTIIFAAFIILGQVIFAMGGIVDNFTLMQLGRFVFGIGGESLAVAQNTYAVSWFKGKELNMVFGFQLSIARVGASVNFQVLSPLYNYISDTFNAPAYSALGWTLMISGSTCVMSFICAIILGWMDKRADRILKKSAQDDGEVVQIKDVISFPLSFWLLSIICLAYYVAIFPFVSLGVPFFQKKFQFTQKNANFIASVPYLISAPASPILGILIDKTGRNVLYVTIAIAITLVCHAMLTFTFINPYFAIAVMGLAYSLLASALWPIAALIIPEYQLGTAYGMMQAIQNLGLALCNMLTGLIVDQEGYIWLEMFFIFWLAVALVCTIAVWLIDISGDGYLNMGTNQREEFDKAKRLKEEEEARLKASLANPIRPRTGKQLRNRYLRRVGASLPPNLGHSRVVTDHHGIAQSPAPNQYWPDR